MFEWVLNVPLKLTYKFISVITNPYLDKSEVSKLTNLQ